MAARWRNDQGDGAAATPVELDRERFHRWWLDEHVAYGKKLPNLRKYRVCLITGSTSHEGREPWDGVAELWFDDRAALDAAWSSEVGQIALAHPRESHSGGHRCPESWISSSARPDLSASAGALFPACSARPAIRGA